MLASEQASVKFPTWEGAVKDVVIGIIQTPGGKQGQLTEDGEDRHGRRVGSPNGHDLQVAVLGLGLFRKHDKLRPCGGSEVSIQRETHAVPGIIADSSCRHDPGPATLELARPRRVFGHFSFLV